MKIKEYIDNKINEMLDKRFLNEGQFKRDVLYKFKDYSDYSEFKNFDKITDTSKIEYLYNTTFYTFDKKYFNTIKDTLKKYPNFYNAGIEKNDNIYGDITIGGGWNLVLTIPSKIDSLKEKKNNEESVLISDGNGYELNGKRYTDDIDVLVKEIIKIGGVNKSEAFKIIREADKWGSCEF